MRARQSNQTPKIEHHEDNNTITHHTCPLRRRRSSPNDLTDLDANLARYAVVETDRRQRCAICSADGLSAPDRGVLRLQKRRPMSASPQDSERMEDLLATAVALEAQGRGAEALELLRQGESSHAWDPDYLAMVLRLVCLFGSREEARQRMEELRQRDPAIELFMQADEDFLPVWNTRPESVDWRQGFGLA